MPGMDGFQVMEGLKEIEQGGYLPVLVITAQPAHKLRALEAGAKDFVSKPNCARASTTFWKCACCIWGWRKPSGNWSEAAR
jgi:CheY-like chemotaxis protein